MDNLADRTRPAVKLFEQKMRLGQFDAGERLLMHINAIIDNAQLRIHHR